MTHKKKANRTTFDRNFNEYKTNANKSGGNKLSVHDVPYVFAYLLRYNTIRLHYQYGYRLILVLLLHTTFSYIIFHIYNVTKPSKEVLCSCAFCK